MELEEAFRRIEGYPLMLKFPPLIPLSLVQQFHLPF